jgi:glycosyltransferase involved in cell wall biosynthesis
MIRVLIPAYNAENYIDDALRTISAELADLPSEICVYNDGSTDQTADVLAQWTSRVPYLSVINNSVNKGVSFARNTLMRGLHQETEFVIFMDADDEIAQGRITRDLARLRSTPDADFCYGLMRLVPDADLKLRKFDKCTIVRGSSLSSATFRPRILKQVGLLDETLSHAEDTDYLLRIAEVTDKFILHDDITFDYRRHDTNATNASTSLRSGMMRAFLRHAQRRRLDPSLNDASKLLGEYAQLSMGD